MEEAEIGSDEAIIIMKHQRPEVHLGEQGRDEGLGLMKSGDQGRTRVSWKKANSEVCNEKAIERKKAESAKLKEKAIDVLRVPLYICVVYHDSVRIFLEGEERKKELTPVKLDVAVVAADQVGRERRSSKQGMEEGERKRSERGGAVLAIAPGDRPCRWKGSFVVTVAAAGMGLRREREARRGERNTMARERRVSRGGRAGTPLPLSQAAPPRLRSLGIALTSPEAAVGNSTSLP
uniref:Uncharacterized protein n=1 Tax=Arachis hypogaea TaxID=3818 RepID=G0Y6V3_ARAHY|nr:unknown [Arachis hypogaea]